MKNVFKVIVEPDEETTIDKFSISQTNQQSISKKAPGRPRKFKKEENTVVLGIRVLEEEARFLEKYGGEYGGKTGYVTHLIRQEMERLNKE